MSYALTELGLFDELMNNWDNPDPKIVIIDPDMSYVEKVPGDALRVAIWKRHEKRWEVKKCFSISHCCRYLRSLGWSNHEWNKAS